MSMCVSVCACAGTCARAHTHTNTYTQVNITVHFYLQLHGILVITDLKYNSKTLTRNDKQNNSGSHGETMHRWRNDSTQNLPVCWLFYFPAVSSGLYNQPVSKHLTQAKMSTTNINANRMDIQLNGNVWKYAGKGRETPLEIMEWVSPWGLHLNTVQHSG